MMWLLVAAQAANMTYTGDPRALFRADDYPAEAVSRGEHGFVIARLLLDDAGYVDSCAVAYSNASKSLDRATCLIIQQRGHFRPAVDRTGRPIYSSMDTPAIGWWLSDQPASPTLMPQANVEIGLRQAPAEVKLPIEIAISYIVDADGRVSDCGDPQGKYPPPLVEYACQPTSLPRPSQIKNKAGQPVAVLYPWKVRFVKSKR